MQLETSFEQMDHIFYACM